jgi:hypothetical protein
MWTKVLWTITINFVIVQPHMLYGYFFHVLCNLVEGQSIIWETSTIVWKENNIYIVLGKDILQL